MQIDQKKAQLRKKTIQIRQSAPLNLEYESQIHRNILYFIKNQPIFTILCYYPMEYELNLIPVYQNLLENTYSLYFPKIEGIGIMNFYRCVALDTLKLHNTKKIYEPYSASEKFQSSSAIVIVPSLLLDKQGNRLGFGQGFYDRFLTQNHHLTPVGVQYSQYIKNNIPKEPWDISMKIVISEQEILTL